MNIAFEDGLSKEEEEELLGILRCNENELQRKMSAFASAAFEEYVSMFLGRKVFRRGSDILEYRLFLLVEKLFDRKIPDEQIICRLFQTTLTESRSLLRAISAKYQYKLKDAIRNSARSVLQLARSDGGNPVNMTIDCHSVVDELNRAIAEIGGNLPPVKKTQDGISTYSLKPSSYDKLLTYYKIDRDNTGQG